MQCPVCNTTMPTGGRCPECHHEDDYDCECPWCEEARDKPAEHDDENDWG